MAVDPERFSELTNALQVALVLASRLVPDVQQTADQASELRAAVERAATAVQHLRPESDESERG